jgi:hypothetical protein
MRREEAVEASASKFAREGFRIDMRREEEAIED